MKFSRVGVGPDGRSRVVETKTVAFPHDPQGTAVERLWSLAAQTEDAPPHPAGSDWLDLDVADGALRWVMWRLAPGSVSHMHHTDTIDCQVVLAGEVTCVLGAGEVRLQAGDAILIPALEHQWMAGPDGCDLSGIVRGLRARP